MSDAALRTLERAGDWRRWSAAAVRHGLITDVGLNDHPLHMSRAVCGNETCDTPLHWSNCWLCYECHYASGDEHMVLTSFRRSLVPVLTGEGYKVDCVSSCVMLEDYY